MTMRSIVFALLLLVTPAAAKDAWHVITSNGFSVEIPAPTNVKEQKVDIGEGQRATMRVWQIRSGGAIYDVTIAEYPKGSIDAAKIDEHLDGARNGAVANSMGPLVGETKIDFAGRPARELILNMSMGYHARTIIFIDGDRLYSLGAITKKDNVRSPDIERYFASFKLTGK